VLSTVIAFVPTSFFFRLRRPFFPEVTKAQKSIPTKLLRAPIIPFREKEDDERKDVEHGAVVVVAFGPIIVLIIVVSFSSSSLRDDDV
jgi:hypothetical protein